MSLRNVKAYQAGCEGPGRSRGLAVVLLAVVLGACGGGDEDTVMGGELSTGTVRMKISNENRLALNRLALNRLALNRLALDRFGHEPIGTAGRQGQGAAELMATEDGREILKYVIQCAFNDGDVLVGEHDGRTYEFPGLLGLLPQWRARALRDGEQRLLSACLLAHVNALGVSVSISLRAHPLLDITDQERLEYTVYEGTFFGQLFDGEMRKVFACQGSPGDAALAHSAARALRVCTDPGDECAIISTGRCRDICEERTKEEGWSGCWAEEERYEETISVYLFADDPSGENRRCDSRGCELEGSANAAVILDCDEHEDCHGACAEGSSCTIDGGKTKDLEVDVAGARIGEVDCYRGNDCGVECRDGASCDIECYESKDCRVECRDGASCDVLCQGNKSCESVECTGEAACEIDCRARRDCTFAYCGEGSSCLLACNSSQRCEFEHCAGGASSCAGNVLVCGRACP